VVSCLRTRQRPHDRVAHVEFENGFWATAPVVTREQPGELAVKAWACDQTSRAVGQPL
jgi:hypothetical protein